MPGFCPSMGEVLSLVTAREPDKAFSAAFLAEVHRAAWNLFSKITQTLSFLWGNYGKLMASGCPILGNTHTKMYYNVVLCIIIYICVCVCKYHYILYTIIYPMQSF